MDALAYFLARDYNSLSRQHDELQLNFDNMTIAFEALIDRNANLQMRLAESAQESNRLAGYANDMRRHAERLERSLVRNNHGVELERSIETGRLIPTRLLFLSESEDEDDVEVIDLTSDNEL